MKKLLILLLLSSATQIVSMEQEGAKPDDQEKEEMLPDDKDIKTEDHRLLAVVKNRIANHVDLNQRLRGVWACPLHSAVRTDANIPITDLLLANGARVDVWDTGDEKTGQLPLHVAVNSRSYPLHSVQRLLKTGANVSIPCHELWKKTPLHLICMPILDSLDKDEIVRRYKIVEVLLDAGADVNARDSDGQTPIYPLAYGYFQGNISLESPVCGNENNTKIFVDSRKALMALLIKRGVNLLHKDDCDKTVWDKTQWDDSQFNYNVQNGNPFGKFIKHYLSNSGQAPSSQGGQPPSSDATGCIVC